jgi:hypothetical protein
LGEPLRRLLISFARSSRRAIRGSLSLIPAPPLAAWYGALCAPPLLSLSLHDAKTLQKKLLMTHQHITLYILCSIFAAQIAAQISCPTNNIHVALDTGKTIPATDLSTIKLDTTTQQIAIYIPLSGFENDTFDLSLCQLTQFHKLKTIKFEACDADISYTYARSLYKHNTVFCFFYGFPSFGQTVKQITFGDFSADGKNAELMTSLSQIPQTLSKIVCQSADLSRLLLQNQIKADTLMMPLGLCDVALKNNHIKTLILTDFFVYYDMNLPQDDEHIEYEDFSSLLKSLNTQKVHIVGYKRTKKWLKEFNTFAPDLASRYTFQQMSTKKYLVYLNQYYWGYKTVMPN